MLFKSAQKYAILSLLTAVWNFERYYIGEKMKDQTIYNKLLDVL